VRIGNRFWELSDKEEGVDRSKPEYDLTKYEAVETALRQKRCKTIVQALSADYM
jgi:hypothetical protein